MTQEREGLQLIGPLASACYSNTIQPRNVV